MDELPPGELPTDDVLVRTLTETDLEAIIRVDRQAMGRPRAEYYGAKVAAALKSGKLQTSLVAEVDGHVVGFMLAQLFYGEFGSAEQVAVLDSFGVDPRFRGQHVGSALMRQLVMNLGALGVERVETQVHHDQTDLLRFLTAAGFAPAPRLCLQLPLSR